jgi:myo-inositol-1(or 4)-monophosphatase
MGSSGAHRTGGVVVEVARRIAEEAGTVLMERFGRLAGHEIERRGRRDVVTAADLESERVIERRLREHFPGCTILAEEADRGRERAAVSGPAWVVDPLDGTVNFVQGIPFFAVSIGLVEDGRPVLGVVHAPALGLTCWGAPGSGAFEGDRPVSVSATPLLEESILGTGFAYERHRLPDDNLENCVRLGARVRDLRRMGAAALDLAFVASGRLDGFWELHLSPWDVAAGAALVRAAGGRVTDQRGGEDWLFGRNLVASNGLLHEALRGALVPLRGL